MSEPVAIDGHDAVAYHAEGRARKGSGTHAHSWAGRRWHFASEENRAAFAADPERYAPAWGGQCGFAVSLGKEAPGSPRHWRIGEDGRLALFLNPVAALLFRLIPGRARAADARWAHGRSDAG